MNRYSWGRYNHHREIAQRFEQDTAEHQLTVLHDDGLYRHLRFRDPRQSMYWFDIITWPGALVINGDMGSYTFTRLTDMFEFFAADRSVNAQYWGEKLQAISRTGGYKEYREEKFKQHVAERLDEWCEELDESDAADLRRAVDRDVVGERAVIDTSDEANAHQALAEFEWSAHRFDDAWEWDLKDYSVQFLWCCHAILWAVQEWRRHLEAADHADAAGRG